MFNDLNANGVRDGGEGPLAGWKVFLDADKDGVLDAGEKTFTTDPYGDYKFTGLAAGAYRVREVRPAGWRSTAPSSGYHDVTFAAAQTLLARNFANTQKALISGAVWNDLDGDGVKEAGEPGLAGRRVFLDTDKDGVWDTNEASTLTDAAGNYSFKTLAAGSYRVRDVLPAGWRRTSPASSYYDLTLGSGGSSTGRNFGGTQKVLISGNVFNDANGNGVKNTGELGLANWRVFVDSNLDGIWQNTEASVLSDSSGNWKFTNLAAGTYRVRVVQQAGWTRTTPSVGYHAVTLVSGGISTGRLFGERRIS